MLNLPLQLIKPKQLKIRNWSRSISTLVQESCSVIIPRIYPSPQCLASIGKTEQAMLTGVDTATGAAIVFGIALALRLAYVLSIDYLPYSDMLAYDQNAMSILEGHGIPSTGDADQYPLYAYLLAATYKLFGHQYTAIRILQALLGSLTCALTMALASSIFRSTSLGFTAGLIAAAYPDLILHSGSILTETLYTVLLMLALCSWQTALEKDSLRWRAAASFFLGLMALTRSVSLFFIPMVMLWDAVSAHPSMRSAIKRVTLIGLVIVIVYTPWAARNLMVYRSLTPVSTAAGFGLWGGNNPKANGSYVAEPWTAEQKVLMDTMTAQEARRYALDQALAWISANPGSVTLLTLEKISCLFGLKPDNVYKGNFFGKHVEAFAPVAAKAALWLLVFWGIAATSPLLRRMAPLYALVASHLLLTLVFFAYARYLAPLLPVLSIFAACGLHYLVRIFRNSRAGLRPAMDQCFLAGLALTLLLILNWGWDVSRNLPTFRTWATIESLELHRLKSLNEGITTPDNNPNASEARE